MNNVRRKELKAILEEIEEIKSRLENVLLDEEEAFDNIPENLQGTERYEKAEETVEYLADAVDNLDEAISSIEYAIE